MICSFQLRFKVLIFQGVCCVSRWWFFTTHLENLFVKLDQVPQRGGINKTCFKPSPRYIYIHIVYSKLSVKRNFCLKPTGHTAFFWHLVQHTQSHRKQRPWQFHLPSSQRIFQQVTVLTNIFAKWVPSPVINGVMGPFFHPQNKWSKKGLYL